MNIVGTYVLMCIMALVAPEVVSSAAAGPVMVEKNLFAQDRRPVPPETAGASQKPNKPGLNPNVFQLDGVVIHGDVKKAMVRIKGQVPGSGKEKSSPFVTVRENEKIGDYQVIKIEPKSISLERDGEITVVNLFKEGKVVPPAPPVPTVHGMQPMAGVQSAPHHGQTEAGDIRSPRGRRLPRPGRPGGGPSPPGMAAPNMPGMNQQRGMSPDEDMQDEEVTDEDLAAEDEEVVEEDAQ